MPRPYTKLYLHLVWATWDRLPLIDPALEERLYRAMNEEFRKMDCVLLAIGGTEDHVHCLISPPVTHSIAEIVKQVKGATSHLMTHAITGPDGFKWQGSYSAFSIMPAALDRLEGYIHNQKQHHSCGGLWPDWERTDADEPNA